MNTTTALLTAFLLAGCVAVNPQAFETPAIETTLQPTTPTPGGLDKCTLTNYVKLSKGQSACELGGTYPNSPKIGAASQPSSCAADYAHPIKQNCPIDVCGPQPTGDLLTCTNEGLVKSECCDIVKLVYKDGTCSAARLSCIDAYSQYPSSIKRPAEGQGRCMTCEDYCNAFGGSCENGDCHMPNNPIAWGRTVNCNTLEINAPQK